MTTLTHRILEKVREQGCVVGQELELALQHALAEVVEVPLKKVRTAFRQKRKGNAMAEPPGDLCGEVGAVAREWQATVAAYSEQLDEVEDLRLAIVSVNDSGAICSANDAARSLFQFENLGLMIYEPASKLFKDPDCYESLLRPCGDKDTENASDSFEVEGVRADGSGFPLEVRMVGVRVGKVTMHLLDVSAQRELERTLRNLRDAAVRTAELQTEFLANMSHEIRTPLNGILGLTQVILGTEIEPEQRSHTRTIASCGETLLTLVNDILDLSKLDDGGVELDPQPTDLRVLLNEVCALLRPRATERNNQLVADFPANQHANVKVDGVRLRQILANLLGNAVKFTESGTVSIVMRWRPKEQGELPCLRFEVNDTGIGIPEDRLDNVFERFVQAEGSTSRKFGGTGLGLSIVQELVNLMGGTIGVSRLEVGTSFHFEIPMERCEAEKEVESAVVSNKRLSGLSILVAEDNKINQVIVRRLLLKQGCEVEVVDDGEKAVARVEESAFDVVLMDCMMPIVDGYEATRRIRAIESRSEWAKPRLGIIALTARAMPGDRDVCLAAGMDDYITKPFSLEKLTEAVLRWIPDEAASPCVAS